MVPRMSGSGRPESMKPLATSSGGNVTGTVRMSDRTPFAAGRHPEGGAAADRRQLRLRDGEVVEQELRRRARDHAEVRQVGRRVAHEKVVDVVLAGVDPGRERGPRRRRFGRVRGLERRRSRPASRARDVRQLALRPSTGRRRCGSIPSNPRITSFWSYFDAPRAAPAAGAGDQQAPQRRRAPTPRAPRWNSNRHRMPRIIARP